MEIALPKRGSTLAATLLIACCSIGAGMIGLPVVSAQAGFLPTTLAMVLCYLFATGTGLLLLEATLWFKEEVNLLSMTQFALGKMGRTITWLLFVFLFYCLFVAYVEGSSQLLGELLGASREMGIAAVLVLVALVVQRGTSAVSLLSRLFLAGMIISYAALLSFGLPGVKSESLLQHNWKATLSVMPILLISFGYQNLVPTLTYYVKRDPKVVKKAIFFGCLIPFAIYSLWNFVILGLLPPNAPLHESQIVTDLLLKASESAPVIFFAKAFSLLAILSPFITNSLAFVDFLKDGLKRSGKLLIALALVPPALLANHYPHLFLQALNIAGGFADVILFGILPVLIVWIGRYHKGASGPYRVFGGRIYLVLIFALSLFFLLNKG